MTAILSVDPVQLQRLAQQIRAATGPAGPVDHRALSTATAALAVPGLVHALDVFLGRWGDALTDLVDDARRLADVLDLTARTYQDVDSLIVRPGRSDEH